MTRYWRGAIRLPQQATEVGHRYRLKLGAVFALYVAVHTGLFLLMVGVQLALIFATGEKVLDLMLLTSDAIDEYVPCSYNESLDMWSAVGHSSFLVSAPIISSMMWPLVLYQIFTSEFRDLQAWYGKLGMNEWPERPNWLDWLSSLLASLRKGNFKSHGSVKSTMQTLLCGNARINETTLDINV